MIRLLHWKGIDPQNMLWRGLKPQEPVPVVANGDRENALGLVKLAAPDIRLSDLVEADLNLASLRADAQIRNVMVSLHQIERF